MRDSKSRRDVLKYGSLIASTGLFGSGVGAVSGSTVDPVRLRGTRDDPVSRREIIQARYSYINEWLEKSARRNSDERLISVATPVPRNSKIGAYNFEMVENGTPVEYRGEVETTDLESDGGYYTSGTDDQFQMIRSEADEHAETRASEMSTETVPDPESESAVGTYDEPAWKDVSYSLGSYENTHTHEPAGRFNYRHDHRGGEGVQAVKTEMDMKSGHMLGWTGGQYHENATFNNSLGDTKHQWDPVGYSSGISADFENRYPQGTESGSVSKSVSAAIVDIGVSFGYTQSTLKMVDWSEEEDDNYTRWKAQISAGSKVGKTNAVYTPISFFDVDSKSPRARNDTYEAVRVTHEARWYSKQWDWGDPGTTRNTTTSVKHTVGTI